MRKAALSVIISHVLEASCFDDIYVDINSDEIKEFCAKMGETVRKLAKKQLETNTTFCCFWYIEKYIENRIKYT